MKKHEVRPKSSIYVTIMKYERTHKKSLDILVTPRERCRKKGEKKLTSVSFMYVCVAGNGEMLVFFLPFFPQQ